jgi:predicted transcriptional regulator of viral defense system
MLARAYGEDAVNNNMPPKQVPMDRWEVFMRTLGDRVSAASEKNLTARCWKPSTLRREIRAVTKSNQAVLRTTFPPAHMVIEQLKRMGWIHSIQVQAPSDVELGEFLLLDMEAGKGGPIYPLELLQAYLPDGVVCYFSAINYYELTTQVVMHHHVARLNPPKAKTSLTAVRSTESEPAAAAVERNPLGTEIFHFEDIGYYLNKRDASLVPGLQLRVVSPRCWLRITTLEQTLLDVLMQPVRCGGEAVALEAWENGVKQMDADRLAEHLAKIQRDDLDRRVGAVLELIGADFEASALGHRLNTAKDRLFTQEISDVPLLAGFEFPQRNKTWKVRTP